MILKSTLAVFLFPFLLALTPCQKRFAGETPEQQKIVKALAQSLINNLRVPNLKQWQDQANTSRYHLKQFTRGDSVEKLTKELLQTDPTLFMRLQQESLAIQKKILAENFRFYSKKELAEAIDADAKLLDELWPREEDYQKALQEQFAESMAVQAEKLIRQYARWVREFDYPPSQAELDQVFGKGVVGKGGFLFPDIDSLKRKAMAAYPEAFKSFLDLDIFNDAYRTRGRKLITKSKRLLVTTAVAGAPLHEEAFASMKTFCQDYDAALLVIPADMKTFGLDERLLQEDWIHVVTEEIELSRFLRISNIKIPATQLNPLTGLRDFGPRGQSVIVASPKMHSLVVPTIDNAKHPHFLLSTGAITVAEHYEAKELSTTRVNHLAKDHHVIGGLLLERFSQDYLRQGIPDFNPMHVRHIEFRPNRGGLFDIDQVYFPAGKIEAEQPEALVVGDIHVGDTDPEVFAAVEQAILDLKPKVVVLHDLFNGHSVSHHDANKMIRQGQKAERGRLDLRVELEGVIDVLDRLTALDPELKIVVSRSNHDLWLDRWLEEGRFQKDPHNQSIGLLLATAKVVEGVDNSLEFAVKVMGTREKNQERFNRSLARPDQVVFLKAGQGYLVGEDGDAVDVGFHGDFGANGAKATIKSMAAASNRVVFGHTHTGARLNGAVNIGPITRLLLDYNQNGYSNWVRQIALVSRHGDIQVLNYTPNHWWAVDGNRKTRRFYEDGYPKLRPPVKPDSGE